LVTVVLRPDRWNEVTATLGAFFGDAPPPDLGVLLATQPEELLNLESRRWYAVAAELPHVDRSRPLVARLFEPRVRGLAAIVRTLDDGSSASLPRHVVLVPSRDPSALSSSLSTMLRTRLDCRPAGTAFECDQHRIELVSRDDDVVVVIDGDARDVAPRSAFEADPGPTPLAIELHAEPIRDVGLGLGATMVRRALASASPEYREEMQIAALAELSSSYLRTGPYGRELAVVRLAIEPRVGVRFEAHLTELGAARIDTAEDTVASSSVASSSVASSNAAPVHVRTRLPIHALRAISPSPFGYRSLRTPGEVANAVQSCGTTCYWQALSAPFAHASLLRRVATDEPDFLTIAVDSSMPVGALDVAIDLRRLGESLRARELVELSSRIATIHLRTRVNTARWVGVLTHDAGVAAPEPPRDGVPARSPRAEETSLVCLERLGNAVSEGLGAWVRVASPQRGTLGAAVRAEANEAAACVVDPALVEERDAWLEVLGRLPE
jgi:hypothetical protein